MAKVSQFGFSLSWTRYGSGSSRETRQGPGSSRETRQNKVLGVAEGQDEVLERSRETGQSSGKQPGDEVLGLAERKDKVLGVPERQDKVLRIADRPDKTRFRE